MPPKKFSLKMDVSDIPDGEKKESPIEVHFGVPWNLGVEHDGENIDVYLVCKREKYEEKPWSIETKYELRLVSVMRKVKKRQSIDHTFVEKQGYGQPSFYNWKDAVGENTADETAVIQCDVTINKMTGIAPKRQRSFEAPEEHLTDVVLKVGERKFHVAKMTLAAQSSHFKTLFFGSFLESKKSEIELNDVDADIFQLFLEIIYGRFEITADNVEGLLELGDKFDAQLVQARCMEFLLDTKDVKNKKKLRLADAYKLDDLLKDCMDSVKTTDELKATLPADLSDFKNSTVMCILERNLSLC